MIDFIDLARSGTAPTLNSNTHDSSYNSNVQSKHALSKDKDNSNVRKLHYRPKTTVSAIADISELNLTLRMNKLNLEGSHSHNSHSHGNTDFKGTDFKDSVNSEVWNADKNSSKESIIDSNKSFARPNNRSGGNQAWVQESNMKSNLFLSHTFFEERTQQQPLYTKVGSSNTHVAISNINKNSAARRKCTSSESVCTTKEASPTSPTSRTSDHTILLKSVKKDTICGSNSSSNSISSTSNTRDYDKQSSLVTASESISHSHYNADAAGSDKSSKPVKTMVNTSASVIKKDSKHDTSSSIDAHKYRNTDSTYNSKVNKTSTLARPQSRKSFVRATGKVIAAENVKRLTSLSAGLSRSTRSIDKIPTTLGSNNNNNNKKDGKVIRRLSSFTGFVTTDWSADRCTGTPTSGNTESRRPPARHNIAFPVNLTNKSDVDASNVCDYGNSYTDNRTGSVDDDSVNSEIYTDHGGSDDEDDIDDIDDNLTGVDSINSNRDKGCITRIHHDPVEDGFTTLVDGPLPFRIEINYSPSCSNSISNHAKFDTSYNTSSPNGNSIGDSPRSRLSTNSRASPIIADQVYNDGDCIYESFESDDLGLTSFDGLETSLGLDFLSLFAQGN